MPIVQNIQAFPHTSPTTLLQKPKVKDDDPHIDNNVSTQEQPTLVQTPRNINLGYDNKDLGNGWYRISPLLNGWTKVVDTGRKVPESVWLIVWVKEPASVLLGVPHEPIPKKSLVYKYIASNDPDKRKVMERLENLLVKGFLDAKDFLGGKGLLSQTGIEIADQAKSKTGKDYFMSVKGVYGIDVAYPNVDTFIEVIEEGNEEKIKNCANYFKGAFAHEMTHFLRGEFSDDFDSGHEIASHAVEILCSMGDNPFRDETLEVALQPEHQNDSYNKDVLTALKVVQQKLIEYGYCDYIPQTYEPKELSKAMQSIDEEERYKVLQNIAAEIRETATIDLFRIAAQVNRDPPEWGFEFEVPVEE